MLHVDGRLLDEAGLAHLQVEEAPLGAADLGIEAIEIGRHPLGIVGDAGEELLYALAVVGQVDIQLGELFRGLRPGLRARADRAALHQKDAVQVLYGDVGGDLHRLLDVLKVFLQGFAGVLADQVHHAHGVLIRLVPDDEEAGREHGQDAGQDRHDGDGRDRHADRTHLHSSCPCASSAIDISRYMFFTEPFQEDCMPLSRLEVT